MTLGDKLLIVFFAFLTIIIVVIVMAFRERKLGKRMVAGDRDAEQASDARVMAIVFGAIMGGMLLTLLVAWLVFL